MKRLQKLNKKMEVFIYKLNEKVFEGPAESLTLPGENGEITILKNHTPIISALKQGIIKVKNEGQIFKFEISAGTIHLHNNRLIALIK